MLCIPKTKPGRQEGGLFQIYSIAKWQTEVELGVGIEVTVWCWWRCRTSSARWRTSWSTPRAGRWQERFTLATWLASLATRARQTTTALPSRGSRSAKKEDVFGITLDLVLSTRYYSNSLYIVTFDCQVLAGPSFVAIFSVSAVVLATTSDRLAGRVSRTLVSWLTRSHNPEQKPPPDTRRRHLGLLVGPAGHGLVHLLLAAAPL